MDLKLTIDYFLKLIDDKGLIQFCQGRKKADHFGYAIEDQARALIVAVMLENKQLVKLFSQLILRARAPKNGLKMIWFKDGSFDQKEDNFGEASGEVLWALGWLKEYSHKSFDELTNYLYQGVSTSDHNRVTAYTLLGMVKLKDLHRADYLAKKLAKTYQENASVRWAWFEDKLFYANALKPWALLEAGHLLQNDKYLKIGLSSLSFLVKNSQNQSLPSIVGNDGWWIKGQDKAVFDQQPIDVAYTILALLSAYRIFGDKLYLEQALFFYSWFHGNNIQKIKMIDENGACFDGLHQQGVNINCGGESTIVYLLASLELQKLHTNVQPDKLVSQKNPHVAGFLESLT